VVVGAGAGMRLKAENPGTGLVRSTGSPPSIRVYKRQSSPDRDVGTESYRFCKPDCSGNDSWLTEREYIQMKITVTRPNNNTKP
jgi:hypothetical protein